MTDAPKQPISTTVVVFWTILFVPFGLIALAVQSQQRRALKDWEEGGGGGPVLTGAEEERHDNRAVRLLILIIVVGVVTIMTLGGQP